MPLPNVDPVAATIAIAFFILLAAIAAHDMRSLRIPNGLSLALLALYPLHAATAPATAWLPGLGVAGVVFVVGLAAFATGRIGGGDIKLLTVVALWAGPDLILPTLVYTGLIGGAMAMLMISPLRFPIACASAWLRLPAVGDVMLGRQIPYGVAIAGAAALTIGGRLLSAA